MFSNTLYVRVSTNWLRLKHLESGTSSESRPSSPFTTQRLLVGRFQVAQHALRTGVKELMGGRLIAVAPRILIQPLEKTEGGLSEVEERVFRELAMAAGARKVVVWVGHELSDSEVRQKLEESRA